MPQDSLLDSKHFSLQLLTTGVYACIHKPGGAAFSNAGIIDLGDQTLVVDAFNTRAAGSALRQLAESRFDRSVETAILTHAHLDHWIGACALDTNTKFMSTKTTQRICTEWAPLIVADFQNSSLWEEMFQRTEQQLQIEQDERVRADHEHMLSFFRYIMAERKEFQPRIPAQIFEVPFILMGSERTSEIRSLGRGHSDDDSVLLLSQEGIAFMGDIGFFDTQPQLDVCDFDLFRQQIRFFLESDFRTLVPGHGVVGSKENLALQLEYIDVLEDLVGKVARRGGSLQEATQVCLPEPFSKWLMGGMGLFEGNVRALFKHAGGEVPEQE